MGVDLVVWRILRLLWQKVPILGYRFLEVLSLFNKRKMLQVLRGVALVVCPALVPGYKLLGVDRSEVVDKG